MACSEDLSLSKENYNDVYLEERHLIQAAANRNRLVVFVGAGTSIPSGMPSWGKAVEKIKEHLDDKNCDNDFLKIPQYYYNEHGRNNYVELMREIFKCKDYEILTSSAEAVVKISHIHILLKRL